MTTKRTSAVLAAAFAIALMTATYSQAAFVSYHDFGATTGDESTGNITTHQSGGGGTSNNALDTGVKNLIRYSDGTDTGVDFSVAGANGMDSRNGGQTGPPAAATPADALFNVPGLNLNNGTIFEGGNGGSGLTTFMLAGLNPGLTYDVAFFGNRITTVDGLEEFILGGADSATNISSAGIIDALTTRQQTRPNNTDVIRWTDINPGADGIITITMDPEFTSPSNIAYLNAMRLEELGGGAATPEPSTALLAVLGLLSLGTSRRRRRR